MEIISEYRVKMPTWALGYLINGDPSGLQQDEIDLIDKKMKPFYDEGSVILGPVESEPEVYFDPFPFFGLACDVEDYLILIH